MNKNIFRAVAISALGLFLVSMGIAQDNAVTSAAGDKYVISAKAGGVNYVEGIVTVVRKSGTSGHLVKGDSLEIGDRVSTGPDGKAEILLNPGSYLRLGTNSAFEFNTTSLDDLQIRLDSGSAMFEVFAAEEFKVSVLTPNAKFLLIESGVFRVDVLPDGSGMISVWEGKAQLGDANATVIKKGRTGILNGSVSKVAKFDRGVKDDLISWSKLRAKLLADATAGLKNQGVRNSLMRSFLGRQWGMYNSFGLWVFDPRLGMYCFLPFGRGWNSPYGYGYGNSFWYYDLPPVIYYSPPPPPATGPANTHITSQGDRSAIPPFVRMEQINNGGGGGGPRQITNSGSPSYNPGPTYSPPASSPPPPPPSSPPPASSPTKDSPTKDGAR